MPTTTTFVLFGLATLALTATPGPGLLYVVARALSQGRPAGFASMFGIESGEVVWLAATATGLAALLATSTAVLDALRWAGAAYLVYLGVQRWRRAGEAPPATTPAALGLVYAQGLFTQLVNPKVAVFFLAFLPQFLDPSRALVPQVAALGVLYIAIAVTVDATYVLGASAARRLLRTATAQRRTARASAVTYVALGVGAAVSTVK